MYGDELNDLSAHIFLRSVHHIPIERGWRELRNDLTHSVPHFWEEGEGVYNIKSERHR